nr:PREDICTED: uncharacterized protein LOC107399117 [Tribolium castaneum]|eukprot:XP_015840301.1 PREDICTED: uncharacterized protein LOC107399117 [Tribolium castaneum]
MGPDQDSVTSKTSGTNNLRGQETVETLRNQIEELQQQLQSALEVNEQRSQQANGNQPQSSTQPYLNPFRFALSGMQAADRVENYSGGIDFDLFMDAIELIAEQNQWTELVTVQVIESKFRGRAKEYYLALKANERPRTCQQMRNWLREIFSKTPNKEEAKRELQRCMRDADESLGAYAHRLKMIANRIFPEDDLSAAQIFHRDRMVVESFLQGIDLRLANEILRAGEFYKINDILPIAQHYENIISRQLEENSFENFRTAIRAVKSAPIPSNAKQSFRARNNKPYFNANHNQRQEGNGQQGKFTDRYPKMRGICGKCFQPGHFRKGCLSNTVTGCYHCALPNTHITDQCPLNSQGASELRQN